VEASLNLDEKSNCYATIDLMTHSNLTAYLHTENNTLGQLLLKLNQLKQWNNWLHNCLPAEKLLTEHCQIVGLDKTSLIVIADNPHWVTRFRFFIPDLLVKLRYYPDLQAIRAICCKVKPPYYPVAARRQTRQRLIISPNTADILQKTAIKIQNEKLKHVLQRMATYCHASEGKHPENSEK